ncbi:LA_2272 family surface repeat-containing protein [Bacteroides sp. UBA939]|uniref:LA_2272 family surface repeat-containing protein n=1 Tax=Bacteroides sp. UBA939 TaxID=1946092 RepID=UPI0025BF2318|nr:hypothetical protein [Bacteroides sp. UBA939]
MRKVLFIFLILLPFGITLAQENQEQNHHSFFHFNIFDYKYYFGDDSYIPNTTHNLTLNLSIDVTKNQYGLIVGTLWNMAENNAYGVQISILGNYVRNQGKGLAIAGLMNIYESHTGVQIGGYSYAEKMKGLQLGLANNSVDMQGAQIGFVNGVDTAHTVRGVQIGLVNMSKSGFQIGLCNVSEKNQYPLGLINIIKNGEMNVGLAYDEIGNVTAQFRSGSQYLYGIIGFGYNVKSPSGHILLQGGIGAHLNLSSRLRIDTELSAKHITRTFLYSGDKDDEEYKRKVKEFEFKALTKYSLGILPSYRLSEKIELFGGPTLSYLQTKTLENERLFPSRFIWRSFTSTSLKQLYIGYSVGLKYILK